MKWGCGGIRVHEFDLRRRVLGGTIHKQSLYRYLTGRARTGTAWGAPTNAKADGLKSAATKAFFERAVAQWEAAGTTVPVGKAVV